VATIAIYPGAQHAERLRELMYDLKYCHDILDGGDSMEPEEAAGIGSTVAGCLEGLTDWLLAYQTDIRPALGVT
jgi:hypothetical protein